MESYSVCDFYDWLLSLNIMHLRFTHVVARLSFFIPFYSFHWVAIPYFAYSFTTLMPVFVSSVFFFFVNKVYWNIAISIHLYIVCDCCLTVMAELSGVTKPERL